jgi:hypothetical protein
MRLCPRKGYSKEKFVAANFEKLCYLKKKRTVPGREQQLWAMRWRGTDGGVQFNEVVGEESKSLGSIDFEEDPSSASADFVGVKIKSFMIYNSQLFSLDGFKTAEPDARDVETKGRAIQTKVGKPL